MTPAFHITPKEVQALLNDGYARAQQQLPAARAALAAWIKNSKSLPRKS